MAIRAAASSRSYLTLYLARLRIVSILAQLAGEPYTKVLSLGTPNDKVLTLCVTYGFGAYRKSAIAFAAVLTDAIFCTQLTLNFARLWLGSICANKLFGSHNANLLGATYGLRTYRKIAIVFFAFICTKASILA